MTRKQFRNSLTLVAPSCGGAVVRQRSICGINRIAATVASLALVCGTILAMPTLASAIDWNLHGSLTPGEYARYVPPLSNPIWNETPYITTELRPMYFYHELPSDFLTGGGHVQLFALQIRVALTERFGFIATKDGYADLDFDAILPDDSGLANMAFGVKYALISEPQTHTYLTAGLRYEAPTGDLETGGIRLQGGGDGLFNLFLSGTTAVGDLGIQGSMGYSLAVDDDHDSSMFLFSLHLDYDILQRFYPIVELNGYHTVDSGNRTMVDFEGLDLVNFGSTDSGTVLTAAFGGRYRINDHIQAGAGYEIPLTDREDLIDWRLYVEAVLTF